MLMKNYQRITTYDMIKIAMFSALLAVFTQISFDLPGNDTFRSISKLIK